MLSIIALVGSAVCTVQAQDALPLTKDLTLAQVLRAVDARTPAVIRFAEGDAAAEAYRLPPHLVGQSLDLRSARTALDFLFGKGWEGSPLPEEARNNANYMLARSPYRPDWAPNLWVCNNSRWTWRWEKKEGGPAGGTIHVRRAVEPDGDVVKTEPFELPSTRGELALNEVLQMIKQATRTVVNVDGNQYAPVKDPAREGAEPRLEPMRVRDVPDKLRPRLQGSRTLGEFLTLLAAGLDAHTKAAGGLWKWSANVQAADDGMRRIIYTLRDYGRR